MLRRRLLFAGFVLLVSVFMAIPVFAASEMKYKSKHDVPRITVEELKVRLLGDAGVYVLDVRTGASYDRSPIRIPGDVRSMFGELKERTKHIPRDAEIVTYCT
ncbi:hypothetical protein MNBD_DELTA01-2087 [hydrothermal vent metagenome]|uniref:Rhodanese domain-containing protein n=1 Tax=hydrothermal vent metagenome TaxID=652676 RepID=A0A3B0QPD8_9ZZZZ